MTTQGPSSRYCFDETGQIETEKNTELYRSGICIKLVNTDKKAKDIILSLNSEAIKSAKISVLQSDKLKVRNNLTFKGKPEIVVEPVTRKIDLKGNSFDLHLDGYSVSVMQIEL